MKNSNKFQTEQEQFWAGDFGDKYIDRNKGKELLASNVNFFSQALKHTKNLKSCIEFGANTGMNLSAIKILFPNIDISAIEINNKAIKTLETVIDSSKIYHGSILDYHSDQKFDLTLIKTVLIHINPEFLNNVYDSLYKYSSRYILVAEYYDRNPTKIDYRGNSDKLYKRDFAGEMLNKFKDLALVDYGFLYHLDNQFPQDDITYFLMEKL